MPSVLITGANRGLGLEFCKQYAAVGWDIVATCRDPARAQALSDLAVRHDRLAIHPLNVLEPATIDTLATQLSGQAFDVLIANAGIYGDEREHGLGNLDYDAWMKTLRTNVLGVVKTVEAFLPHLKRSNRKLIVALSSLMGSIADNTSGGSILYRSSKAALNAAMKSIAIDLAPSGVGVLIFHPGWVKTDMGGPNALIDTDVSIAGMRKVIDDFTMQQTGRFVKYDGTPMPW